MGTDGDNSNLPNQDKQTPKRPLMLSRNNGMGGSARGLIKLEPKNTSVDTAKEKSIITT